VWAEGFRSPAGATPLVPASVCFDQRGVAAGQNHPHGLNPAFAAGLGDGDFEQAVILAGSI